LNFESARPIADAVLLEGYVLYPYRPDTTKNRYRWTFGVLAPRAWSEQGGSDPWWLEAQLLVAGAGAWVSGRLRFLRVVQRRVESCERGPGYARFVPTERLEVDGVLHASWEEGLTTETDFDVASSDGVATFVLPASETTELLRDRRGQIVGRIVRETSRLEGAIRWSTEPTRVAGVTFVSVRVENVTPFVDGELDRERLAARSDVMRRSLTSTQVVLGVTGGAFVSAVDPPAELAAEAARCRSVGTFPSLLGDADRRDLVLAAPICLGDHPRIAPESRGDFFDACEIDEILALRTRTLGADEKALARATDVRAAAVVDRVESFGEGEMSELHGAMRERRTVGAYGPGSRVRILPPNGTRRTDAQDLLYVGRIGRVESIRQDVDGTDYLALTIEGDPAAELHRWYGRFHYYRADEVEPA
jgi:hypothetical protein